MTHMGILERAAVVPLTEQELAEADRIIAFDGLCIAHIQRKLRIGWNRAADLAEAVVGFDALPEVAQLRYSRR
ncbi:hypothetical protein [Burkholderia sp. Ac-20365]|uniref:hypothetical protein n=1 Tax=Burkholderia sp. Ac-20365 TaxID=2703897 RepID=UPI00197B4077|nr:hypothetical protein [Burkholderia sp. Ac-20365]MBN3761188.1 hypothetical protein [Burkholderia sp. Ac-20365]